MIYYVYAYLDPRKPGNFKYGEFTFNYEPFYIGKGKNDRINAHFKKYYKGNKYLGNKIQKIIKETRNLPITIKVKQEISEEKAFEIEKLLIKLIGRRDLKLGPLCNMTDGGEGLINCSEITRNKLRKPFSIERRKNISKGKKGKKVSQKVKDLLKFYQEVEVITINKDLKVLKKYNSMKEAATDSNRSIGTIWNSCNYYYNLSTGLSFRYLDDVTGHTVYLVYGRKNKPKERRYIWDSKKHKINKKYGINISS